MNASNESLPGVAALLLLADRIQGHARRLENLATWPDRLERHSRAVEAGEAAHGRDELLRLAQARRDSGQDKGEKAFFMISWLAESWAETVFDTDPELNELSGKIRAIEQREGLAEGDEFDADHPETPADWKALNAEADRRYEEVARIIDERLVAFLLRHGEVDMADLYVKDRAGFERRREAGRCSVFGPMPDLKADMVQEEAGAAQASTSEA